MTDEMQSLIEDAAKLLGLAGYEWVTNPQNNYYVEYIFTDGLRVFNPCDPDRGDLMKVAEAAELHIDFENGAISAFKTDGKDFWDFEKSSNQSLCYAILRAASAVWKARGGV